MWSSWAAVAFLAVCPLLVTSQQDTNMPGLVKLTDGTFDKIVSKFKYTLVKFDTLSSEWTHSQLACQDVARDLAANPDFLLAEVNVHDPEYEKKTRKPKCEREKDPKILALRGFGPRQNLELHKRFKFKMTDYPAYRLMIRGQDKPEVFEWDTEDADHIRLFLFKKTGLWLCPSSCIRDYDKLAEDLFSATDEESKKQPIIKGEKQLQKIQPTYRHSEKQMRRRAKFYTKLFKAILSQGEELLQSLREEVSKALDGEVRKKKRDLLEERQNIIKQMLLIRDRVRTHTA